MKKSKLYFPLETDLINQINVSALIENCGPKGFGTYVMILTELRNCADYRCSLNALKGMARRCKIHISLLKQVLYDFGLFDVDRENGEEIISSPYIDRVMKMYDEKLEKLVEGGKKRSDKSVRGANGQFTSQAGALDKIRLDKKKTATTVAVKDDAAVAVAIAGFKNWEDCFAEAMKEELWLEIVAMNSGMSQLFVKHRKWVIEAFRQHIILQGKGSTLHYVGDIKSYFANFMRQGTPTQKRIAQQLAQIEKELQQTSAHRYETIDMQTGERTYYGNPIPRDAPPRPNENAVWSKELNTWI
jgi:hypothetical protein